MLLSYENEKKKMAEPIVIERGTRPPIGWIGQSAFQSYTCSYILPALNLLMPFIFEKKFLATKVTLFYKITIIFNCFYQTN